MSKKALPHSCLSALQCSHAEAVTVSGLKESVRRKLRPCSNCSRGHLWSAARARLPILDWLPKYRVCDALLGDVIAGVTVGVMHIPQGKLSRSWQAVYFPILNAQRYIHFPE